MSGYNAPSGTSVVYTDSVPLLSILLKILGVEPVVQFHGLWIGFCVMAQFITGYILLFHASRSRMKGFFGALFLGTLPPFLARATGGIRHYTLLAHFFVLLPILFHQIELRRKKPISGIYWFLLLWVCLGAHFYLLFFAGIFFFLSRIRHRGWKLPDPTEVVFGAWFGVSAMAFGYFKIPLAGANNGAAGEFSMNLLSPFSPFLSSHYPVQIEGYAFMGWGLLFLLITALLDQENRKVILGRFQRYRDSYEMTGLLFLILYSCSIYFPVWEWRLNRWLTMALYFVFVLLFFRFVQRRRWVQSAPLSILLVSVVYFANTYVRSSGRGASVLVYFLIYGLFTLRLRVGLILAALLIQVVSVLPWASLIHQEHIELRNRGRDVVRDVEARLENSARVARRIFLYSNEQLPENRLAWLALKHRVPVGPSYVARSDLGRTGAELAKVKKMLLDGSPEPGVLVAVGDPGLASILEAVPALDQFQFRSEGVLFVFRPE